MLKISTKFRTYCKLDKMHIDFDPNNVDWHHLIQPTSVEKQFGGGAGYTPFAGLPYQRGAGIGSIFRSLLRFLIPIGKEAGAAIGRQGLESGVRVLNGVLEGRDLQQSLKDEGRSGLKNLLDKASNNLTKRNEEAAQTGSGNTAFDFKRYKRELSSQSHANMNSFHKETFPQKTINRNKRGSKSLHSTIGPPLLPTSSRKRPLNNNKSLDLGKQRKLRIDSLGIY